MSDYELTPEEIAELGAIVRGADGHAELEAPPAAIWQSIESELHSEFDAELENQFEAETRNLGTSGVPDNGRSSKTAKYLLAAAVVVIGAIGLGTLLRDQPEETVLATAVISNEGLPNEFSASGTANLVSADGMLRLDLDVEQLETDEGYFELWVARPDASAVESLGAISGDGSWDWPDGVDPDDFSAVAISLEENDGDPSFSGIAVVFGVLEP